MSKGAEFRKLHVKGEPLILANAWDIGSARLLVAKGAKAIGTSSAAHAFTLGLADMGNVSRSQAIDHASDLAESVSVPVSADLENGYGNSPIEMAQTIKLAHEIGLAGCSIEDTDLPKSTPFEFDEAVSRVEAAVNAREKLSSDFVLCARADGLMLGTYDLDEAIRRLRAFEDAGADVLYAPLPKTWDDLRRIIDAVDKPVNVLVAGAYAQHSYDEFAKIGAARLSFGSALARVTHQAMIEAADHIFEKGDFSDFQKAASGDEVDQLLVKGRGASFN